MWVCEKANGEVFPICVEMPDRKQRDAFADALKLTFKRHTVARYVSMVEAWVLIMPEENKAGMDFSQSLKDHPDRREAIFIQAEDIDGSQRSGQYYILRPEHGKPTLSTFKSFDDQTKPSEGRFARLLSKEE